MSPYQRCKKEFGYFGKSVGTVILLAGAMMFLAGCGSVTVRHVPKFDVSSSEMSDLHGSQPIDLKAGECSTTEETFGTVGIGKVVGTLAEWTGTVVAAIRANLSARGATITTGAPKVLTITMTKAEVRAIPIVGVSKSKIVLRATTSEGLDSTFEGSRSSLAPLSAVDNAVADAVEKILTDAAVDAYLHK